MYAERQKARNGGNLTRKEKKILEIYIPSFSICALLGVTGYILSDAIDVIKHGDKDDVNVFFLFGFASGNFLVDIISTYMFYWRGHEVLFSSVVSLERQSVELRHNSKSEDVSYIPNLNMISALTHVGSDTLRTTSVFIAAIISQVGGFNAAICDAWAAVVVSFTILVAIIPLVKEIWHAYHRVEEEELDTVMDESAHNPTHSSESLPSTQQTRKSFEQSV